MYHAVSIRQGPFRLELPLAAPVDAERVEVRYERGLLRSRCPSARRPADGGRSRKQRRRLRHPRRAARPPLRDAVVLPSTAVPLAVGQPRSVRLVDEVMRGNRLLALVAQRDAKVEPSAPGDLHGIGTVGMIHQLMRAPDGSVRLMVQGIERIRLLDFVSTEPYLVARVEVAREQVGEDADIEGLRRAVVDIFRRLVEASAELPDELAVAAENVPDPLRLAYFVASVIPLDVAVRQELLEMDPVASKLRRLVDLLQKELAVRELGRKITTETEERLTKKQREYLSARAASLHPAGARGGGGRRKRSRRAAPPHRGGGSARGGQARSGAGAEPARRSLARLARARHDRHVSRVAGQPALDQAAPAAPSTSIEPARCWTRTTSTSRRSRTGSSSIWR